MLSSSSLGTLLICLFFHCAPVQQNHSAAVNQNDSVEQYYIEKKTKDEVLPCEKGGLLFNHFFDLLPNDFKESMFHKKNSI